MKLHYLQHVPFEDPAGIGDWASANGHVMVGTHLYRDDALPGIDSFDGLVVMGGPMGVYDTAKYNWLTGEIACVRATIDTGRPVLGVCLGAQLIAAALGAKVYPNDTKEIGFFDVDVTEAGRTSGWFGDRTSFAAFHWHGDTFDLPTGATRLASTPACSNQAFVIDDRVMGLQFHVESTPASVGRLIDHCADEIVDGPYIQSTDEMRSVKDRYVPMNEVLTVLLSRLFG